MGHNDFRYKDNWTNFQPLISYIGLSERTTTLTWSQNNFTTFSRIGKIRFLFDYLISELLSFLFSNAFRENLADETISKNQQNQQQRFIRSSHRSLTASKWENLAIDTEKAVPCLVHLWAESLYTCSDFR